MTSRFFHFFFLICFVLFRFQIATSEDLDLSLLPSNYTSEKIQSLKIELESLNTKIEHSELYKNPKLINLYNERGVLLLISGEYERAIKDFTYVIDTHFKCFLTNDKIFGRALWGRMWGFALLGKKEEFINDLNAVAEFAELYACCSCGCLQEETPIKQVEHEHCLNSICQRQNNDDEHTYWFCEKTIDNMMIFMKTMCNIIKDPGIKSALYLFIDGLGKKAKECCSSGGFWRECVQPMLDIANKWKLLGIPSDPYWD